MQRTVLTFIILALVAWGTAFANTDRVARHQVQGPVLLKGLEDTPYDGMEFPARPVRMNLDDPIAPIYVVGTTWYDNQHNGTAGKQLAVDRYGFVHHVWTRGANSGSSIRHVYYNVWDPSLMSFMLPDPNNPIGTQVDQAPRAGFVTVDVNEQGFAFPVFHQGTTSEIHGVVAIDYLPALGAFAAFQPCSLLVGDPQLVWPTSAVDRHGKVHVTLTESEGAGAEYYSRGTPQIVDEIGEGITWDECLAWEQASFITIDVAASPVSDKIAVAWLVDPVGEHIGLDVWVKTSDDGGVTWNAPRNITNFQPLDTMCVLNGGDPFVCNGDTIRPWIDLSVLIDQNDVTHVAFTGCGFFWWDYDGTPLENHGYVFSSLWHWDDARDQYNFVHDAWYSHTSVALGSNNLMVHRPNLAIDTVSGFLYCSFHKFDSVQVSANGYPQGDIWITVSTDGGRRWAEATNVTNTDGGVDTPAGQCLAERDATLAKFVTNGFVHMQYMLDLDAGTSITETPEGVPTQNNIYYMPIPVDLIPISPLVDERPLRADSTGFPPLAADRWSAEIPTGFRLYPNYPNPFNSRTNIQFDLPNTAVVDLRVFDVLGREAAVLVAGERMQAGTHVLSLDAASLPSGLYFYRMEAGGLTQTCKMVLMR
ncbi:MAG: T9SS type A sorting domain-containing protein [bacterium]|nr:T9SS type A sorting domain-containing protein [bacterium]